MKEQTLYICEFCETKYADKEEAKKCERSHVVAMDIVDSKYLPYKNDGTGKPHKVRIRFSDGTEWTYSK